MDDISFTFECNDNSIVTIAYVPSRSQVVMMHGKTGYYRGFLNEQYAYEFYRIIVNEVDNKNYSFDIVKRIFNGTYIDNT